METGRTEVESRIGTTLAGKYRLARLLGAGGMGAVYEAQNEWTHRRVAVKLMLGATARDRDLAARFLREARAASRIEHPNVVQILDMGEDETRALYIVQEFLDGADLRHLLDQRGALPPRDAIEILAPVMSALVAAHRLGIVHRDLKPENIFLVKTGGGHTPKLIDFGIAKMNEGGDAPGLTRTGAAMGTPFYMSPEQAGGEKNIDAQTDVWAMGVVLFEVLAGRVPWTGDNYNALIIEISNGRIPALNEFAPGASKQLADVVQRALARPRDQRYRTMQNFLGDLLDCPTQDDGAWRTTLRSTHESALQRSIAAHAVVPVGEEPTERKPRSGPGSSQSRRR